MSRAFISGMPKRFFSSKVARYLSSRNTVPFSDVVQLVKTGLEHHLDYLLQDVNLLVVDCANFPEDEETHSITSASLVYLLKRTPSRNLVVVDASQRLRDSWNFYLKELTRGRLVGDGNFLTYQGQSEDYIRKAA